MSRWQIVALVLLIFAACVSALAVVQQRHDSRILFIELQAEQGERDDLNIEWGRLQLEYSTLSDMSRIERISRTKLGMQTPALAEIMVLPDANDIQTEGGSDG